MMKLGAFKSSVEMLIDHVQFNTNIDARLAARGKLIDIAIALHQLVEADTSARLSLPEKQDRRARAVEAVKAVS
jgi:hypothetical protein